jgi:hypothetical protein
VRGSARRARVSFTDAQALVMLARGEPRRGEADPGVASATLGALRRVVYAIHALRLQIAGSSKLTPRPQLKALSEALDDALTTLSMALRYGDSARPLPPLRRLFRKLQWEEADQPLRSALDELVDAIDSAATSAGLQLP